MRNATTRFALAVLVATTSLLVAQSDTSAEVVIRGGNEGAPESEIRKAPAYVYPDFHTVAAQPSPSEVNPSFFGPVLLMKLAIVDLEHGTATLPLRHGKMKTGEDVWFVLTDASDENIAALHGINYSPKTTYSDTRNASRHVVIEKDGTWIFDRGRVDFRPQLAIEAGPEEKPFPPKVAHPGSIGDADYTPLVHVDNSAKGLLFNAPVVSLATEDELNRMCDGRLDKSKVHDKITAVCPREGAVTLRLTIGESFNKPVLYLSTEANDPLVATLETATYAPALKELPFALEDASPGESAERLIVVVNGPTGVDNPQRQGLYSALMDGRGPINVLGGIPTINLDYSPMWRLFPAVWTDEAVSKGYRFRLTSPREAAEMSERGFIKSLDGGPFRPIGFVVNCPIVYRFE